MKRTAKAAKTKQHQCEHPEVTPIAAFVDDNGKEAFLLQHCEQCGQAFLLMGQYPLTIY